MTYMLNMNGFVYFEAVARHSSINVASQELNVSPSAVSQQIKLLEERLGVALFRRIKRRLTLSEEGEQLFLSTNTALKLLRDSQERVAHTQSHRKLTVRVSPSFGVRWLGKLLVDYVTANPDIDLRIDATSEITDFEKENIDLEIRYSLTPPKGFHSQAFITDYVLPLCAPQTAALAKQMGCETVLSASRLLHTVKARITWQEWLDHHRVQQVDSTHGLFFDRSSMSLQAAKDGLGVILETTTLAMDELQTGTLVPLASELGAMAFEAYWLVCPPRHLNRRAVQSFIGWIEEQAASHEINKARLLNSLQVDSIIQFPSQLKGNG